jgi:hypothetical protein
MLHVALEIPLPALDLVRLGKGYGARVARV